MNIRVLVFAETRSVQQERIMRLMLILILSFCISACVIDWAFNATFFYLAAVSSVFFRLAREQEIDIQYELFEETASDSESEDEGEFNKINSLPEVQDEEEFTYRLPLWTRMRWYDYLAITISVLLFLRLWKYAIEVEF